MRDIRIRCSALSKIMTNPTAAAIKAGEVLSVGAKTYIRKLAAEDIFGVEFEVSAKTMEKGKLVESESIALYNRVFGTKLEKNTERRTDDFITGEPDLIVPGVRGIDIKSAWSLATFPIALIDCQEDDYEWQARGYMRLWDVPVWDIAYCMVSTPDNLIGYEEQALHLVDHLPESLRVSTWRINRDKDKEALIETKVKAARAYYQAVIKEFDRSHDAAVLLRDGPFDPLVDALRRSVAAEAVPA